MRLTRLLAPLWGALTLAGAAAAQGAAPTPAFGPVDTGHLVAELIPEAASIAPGQTIHVALAQTIDKGWHTYWRNPGDSGEPSRIEWSLPAGWTASDFVWPAPTREPIGPLMNYGYSDRVLLPVKLTAPADAKPGQSVEITGAATFLVCEEICVPESAVLGLRLPVSARPGAPHSTFARPIAAALAAAPQAGPLTAAFSRQGEALSLAVVGAPLRGADLSGAYFFPYDGA
ncbi:MAG: protein-disulfide reductase DsbD domain-containing protein, partial [Phenylobacterium sp.]